MRILAFSDLHRDTNAARSILAMAASADIVIGAGDFATRGHGHADTLDILRDITAPMILVAGNHDRLAALRAACHDRPNFHLLHGDAVTLGGVAFYGLGYEIPPTQENNWNKGLDEATAAQHLAACPPGAVLVTHSPPFGTADVQRDGHNAGSHAIRAAILSTAPLLHLCGHIHHAWGTSGMIAACKVHNLGPTVTWFAI